jgi:predicted ATPase
VWLFPPPTFNFVPMAHRVAKTKRSRAPGRWAGVFLRSATLERGPNPEHDTFPFTVPVIRALGTLEFPTAVTFLVGENGSGKSTLLEGVAAATGLPTVGSDSAAHDATLSAARALAQRLTLTWDVRTHRGFFLRAEDFFGFTKRVSQIRTEMVREVAEATSEYESQDRSERALGLRLGPLGRSLAEMQSRYGLDFDAHSHGESFLELFRSRFVPGGLYLLDEPEAPLSPQSQLALITMMGDMIEQRAQFVIATHSPILLAFPGATIYTFDRAPPAVVPYGELDHVTLTRDFLADPARFLRHLLGQHG